ncbi:MAG: hypothetical protein OFPII_29710 [Osedax symbiont Rs1]|nr:MAG: hypothetical protein OFPII_29710 [Osedax symbiont Rs1]
MSLAIQKCIASIDLSLELYKLIKSKLFALSIIPTVIR